MLQALELMTMGAVITAISHSSHKQRGSEPNIANPEVFYMWEFPKIGDPNIVP